MGYIIIYRDTQSFSISMGIFILSYAGHACLPQVYNNMSKPKDFEKVVNTSFLIMFITYSSFAVFGYLQYGLNTNVIITGNLLSSNNINIGFMIESKILIIFVILSVYFQITPIISVTSEIPEMLLNIFPNNTDTNDIIKSKRFKMKIFRSIVSIFGSILAYYFLDNLPILEACTGSLCTMITAVICPALFYGFLYKKELTFLTKFTLILYIIIGITFAIYGTFNDILSALQQQT